jgi:uncharacterized protein YebE (UPF0316 family)
MDVELIVTCALIVLARIADVSLGTIRTVFVVRGHRMGAFVLGFCEVLVWVVVVSRVIANLNQPAYAVSYALGFALGNYAGMTLERWLAYGKQAVRIFTRQPEIAAALRGAGFAVTEFEGLGRDGVVHLLYVQTHRREVERVVHMARSHDPNCFYTVEDIRLASSRFEQGGQTAHRRSLLNRK